MGGAGGRSRSGLHDLGGIAMTMDNTILTLVTFVPLAGALLLLLFPRNDNAIRWGALGNSLLTFMLSLHLPFHFDNSKVGREIPSAPHRIALSLRGNKSNRDRKSTRLNSSHTS